MDTQDIPSAVGPLPALRVRPSTEADVAAIAAIYGHHVLHGTGSFETEPPGVEEMRRRADVLARGLPHLVAEDGDGHMPVMVARGRRQAICSALGRALPASACRFAGTVAISYVLAAPGPVGCDRQERGTSTGEFRE